MSTGGSTRAIIAALLANMGIAVAKFVGFAITQSSSMLAESVHSVADSGNQALLLLGQRKATKEADEDHPFGYGRYRYFYAFVVALVLFALGSLFALYEGIHKLQEPTELSSPLVAVVILVVAIGLESYSFRTAIVESNHVRGTASWPQFIRRSRTPELPVVLLEDLGALVGLVLALAGVGMTVATGNPVWDAIGTLSISALLGVISVVLVIEMKSLLIGESALPEEIEKIRTALVDGEDIERIIHLRTQHLGPEELLVAAKVAMPRTATLDAVAAAIDAAEARVRAAVPSARVIYVEPDLLRTEDAAEPTDVQAVDTH